MKKAISFGAIVLLFTSCTNTAKLTYNPVFEERPSNGQELMVMNFRDSRHTKDMIGHFRNEHGIPERKVLANCDVSEWATKALKEELTRAGYYVEGYGSESNTVITGDLIEAYCDIGSNYNGRVKIAMKVKRDGKTIIKKEYSMEADLGSNWLNNPRWCAKGLENSLQKINSDFIKDLDRKLLKN